MEAQVLHRHESSMFTRAYLQEAGNGRLEKEERLIQSECERLGIPVTVFPKKRIQRRQLPLEPGIFICGDVDSMHGAMKQMHIPAPVPHDYPESLSPWFGRRIWKTTLGSVSQPYYNGAAHEIFVKPADRQKHFTGRVISSFEDLHAVSHVSQRETVWCSEVVAWLSEYRVYVVGEEIISVAHYMGQTAHSLCMDTVRAALKAYAGSGEAPAAYGIDFGVLDSGQTALVEANDGYSLGAYEIGASEYAQVLFARWQELSRQARLPT